jgi:predicted Zn-dependent protease
MTGTATAAGVAGAGNFGHGLESTFRDLGFNRPFRDKEARADERLIAAPLLARRIAVFTNRLQQRVTRKLRTVFSVCFQTIHMTAQVDYSSFRGTPANDLFGEQRS